MRIISIDPGFERLGIAILEREVINNRKIDVLIFSECFKTKSSLPFPERLNLLGGRISALIKEYNPEIMALETLFFATNQKTVMHVSEARGVIIYEGIKNRLQIMEYTPLQIKIAATGYGRATKDQVDQMVRKLIKIEKTTKIDDEMDAIACGITCLAHLR